MLSVEDELLELELEPELGMVLAIGVDTPDEAVAPEEAEGEAPLGVETAATKGLVDAPPVPFVKSRLKLPIESCCWNVAEVLAELIADPPFSAQIQLAEDDLGSILPPFQLRQLSHRTLAT